MQDVNAFYEWINRKCMLNHQFNFGLNLFVKEMLVYEQHKASNSYTQFQILFLKTTIIIIIIIIKYYYYIIIIYYLKTKRLSSNMPPTGKDGEEGHHPADEPSEVWEDRRYGQLDLFERGFRALQLEIKIQFRSYLCEQFRIYVWLLF